MFKLLLILPLLGLTACVTTSPPQIIIKKEYIPLDIDESFFTCPFVPKEQLPNPETATNVQVAQTLADTRFNNEICYNSMTNLEKVIKDANATIIKK